LISVAYVRCAELRGVCQLLLSCYSKGNDEIGYNIISSKSQSGDRERTEGSNGVA